MLKKEEISQAHPILELYPETVKCMFFGQIRKINTKKQLQARHLLVTNAAIFLLVKKKFPSGFRLSRFISYDELTQVSVMTSSEHAALHGDDSSSGSNDVYVVSIYTHGSDPNEQHLALKFEMADRGQLSEIIARILIIKSSLFPKSKGILSQSTPEAIKELINQSPFIFDSNSLFADRFLSLCVTDDSSPQLNSQILELYNNLSEITNDVIFSEQMLSYIFITQFTEAIAKSTAPPLHDKSFEVHFEKGNYEKVAKCLQILLSQCSFVDKIIFDGIIFSSLENISNLLPESHQTSLSSISFNNSNLKASDFKNLINNFNHYKGKITSFSLNDCEIDEHNIKFLFNTIFDAPCFRYLKTLSLGGIDEMIQIYIMQFMGSNNVLTNKTIETLSVNNSNLAIENLLISITLFETGLKNLILTSCQFVNPIPPKSIQTFQQLQVIDLSHSQMNSKSLLSLFTELSAVSSNDKSPAPSSLILNDLVIPKEELPDFYNQLNGQIVINTLKSFSWANNVITENDVDPFFSFLKKQVCLRNLNISFCLNFPGGYIDDDCEVDDKIIEPFTKVADHISSLSLESLSIRGEDKTSFKEKCIDPILTAYRNRLEQIQNDQNEEIEIDFRGQQIGTNGISILNNIVSTYPSVKSFFFDSSDSEIENLIELLTSIVDLQTDIENTFWPEKDIKSSLKKVNPTERSIFMNTINELKKKFERRFGKSSIPKSNSISDTLKASAAVLERSSSKGKFFLPSQNLPPKGKKGDKPPPMKGVQFGAGAAPAHPSSREFRKRGLTTTSNTVPKLVGYRTENISSVHQSGQNRQGSIQEYVESLVCMKETEISQLLSECLGEDEIDPKKDPLVVTIQNIQNSVELPSL